MQDLKRVRRPLQNNHGTYPVGLLGCCAGDGAWGGCGSVSASLASSLLLPLLVSTVPARKFLAVADFFRERPDPLVCVITVVLLAPVETDRGVVVETEGVGGGAHEGREGAGSLLVESSISTQPVNFRGQEQ